MAPATDNSPKLESDPQLAVALFAQFRLKCTISTEMHDPVPSLPLSVRVHLKTWNGETCLCGKEASVTRGTPTLGKSHRPPSENRIDPPRKIARCYDLVMETSETVLKSRRVLPIALRHMTDDPVVLLEGPRSVGKSTLIKQIAQQKGGRVLDLDDPATLDAVRQDPATMLSGSGLVCIDEYQRAPVVLDVIKTELNRRTTPGKFVLTGSAQHEALPHSAQALTGRLDRIRVLPLSQGEIAGIHENWLETLFEEPLSLLSPEPSTTIRSNYIERMIRGGFPLALNASTSVARNRWLDNYLALTLNRDVRELSEIKHGTMLHDLLQRLAGQSAQVLNVAKTAESIGLEPNAAKRYITLLENVFLVYRLPAWGTTLNSRSSKQPKIHIVDSAIAARVMRLTQAKVERNDPSGITEFGHLMETFVIGELHKQLSWLEGMFPPGHWRTHDSREVDFVLEREDGSVIAIEVKASARTRATDFHSLELLRDKLGSAFIAGVVLYPGQRSFTQSDRIMALPTDQLWTAGTR